MTRRPGISLVECLIALALGGVTMTAATTILVTQSRLIRHVTAQSADSDARRVTAAVLRAELRWLEPRADVRSVAGDSVAVRLFRGAGIVCAVNGDHVTVRYEGAREPDPAKDSVILVTDAGEVVQRVRHAEAYAPCAGGPGVRLRLAAPPPGALQALVFESGTYFVRERALRFRLGREGRQPLTDERFAASGPAISLDSLRRIIVPLRWPPGIARGADTVSIPLPNGR